MNQLEVVEEEQYPVSIGDVVSERFRIDRFIGIGAMGLVVEAHHLQLEQRVAIKFLRRSALKKQDAVGRFAREARATVRLKSEHVATVLDVGETSDGTPYIVMEYLEGANLDDVIEREGRLSLPRAVELAIQLCEALAEAHSIGIIHRDLKPANVFLTHRSAGAPIAKLIDFGISKAALTGEYTENVLDAQKTSVIMGTPLYMAPEQVRSTRDVDARADIWSLGVVLFELITGQQVWRSEELGQLVPEIMSSTPRRISEAMPGIDPAFDAVLARALAPDPDERYATAADFARALLPFGSPASAIHVERASSYRQSEGSERSIPLLRQSSRDLAASAVASARPGPPPSNRNAIIIAAVIVGLAIVGMIVLVLPRIVSPSTPSTSSSVSSADTISAVPVIPGAAAVDAPKTEAVPAVPAERETASAKPMAPVAPVAPPRNGRLSWPPPPRPNTAPVTAAPAVSPPPAPAPASAPTPAAPKAGALENDPWRSRQPKLEDNPFK